MGLYTEFVYCEPDDIIIDYDSLTINSQKCFDHMCNKRMNCKDPSSKTSGKELEEHYCECMKLYEYLGMDALINWNNFLMEVLKQNSTVNNIKFHFYYRDGKCSFYFEINKQSNENPVTSISTGSELDVLCFDISSTYGNIIPYLPELIKIKMERMYRIKQKNNPSAKPYCIPWREIVYEYEFNKKNYKKYYTLMQFETKYFSDEIEKYKKTIQKPSENEIRMFMELFPYCFTSQN